jgi:hypothetical protein
MRALRVVPQNKKKLTKFKCISVKMSLEYLTDGEESLASNIAVYIIIVHIQDNPRLSRVFLHCHEINSIRFGAPLGACGNISQPVLTVTVLH